MKSNKIDLNIIKNISENQHNLSNILSAVVLTLDICESVTELSPEDFTLIKEELVRAMQLLKTNQQILGSLIEKETVPETKDDSPASTDAAYEPKW